MFFPDSYRRSSGRKGDAIERNIINWWITHFREGQSEGHLTQHASACHGEGNGSGSSWFRFVLEANRVACVHCLEGVRSLRFEVDCMRHASCARARATAAISLEAVLDMLLKIPPPSGLDSPYINPASLSFMSPSFSGSVRGSTGGTHSKEQILRLTLIANA